jgi:hypothetical protein
MSYAFDEKRDEEGGVQPHLLVNTVPDWIIQLKTGRP